MISFLIPAHNERQYIYETVISIRQIMPDSHAYEIILIDNASTDGTTEVLPGGAVDSIVCLPKLVSISAARNAGVNACSGDILIFLDADVLVTVLWAGAILNFCHEARNNPYLISGCKVAISKNPSWIELLWFSNMKKPGKVTYINSGNLVTTRSVFNLINGFDEQMTTGEDVDFCIRAKNAGATIIQDPNFFAHHEGYPKNIRNFFRREQWHGIGDIETFEKFLNSKVAIFSYGLMAIFLSGFFLCLLNYWLAGVTLMLLSAVLNSFAVNKRFNFSNLSTFISISFLHVIYVVARCTSIFVKSRKRIR